MTAVTLSGTAADGTEIDLDVNVSLAPTQGLFVQPTFASSSGLTLTGTPAPVVSDGEISFAPTSGGGLMRATALATITPGDYAYAMEVEEITEDVASIRISADTASIGATGLQAGVISISSVETQFIQIEVENGATLRVSRLQVWRVPD